MITDNRIWECLFIILGGNKYLEVTSIQDMPYAVIAMENPEKVICRMETEEFRTVLQYVAKWYQDGIIDSDILGLSDNEANRAVQMLLADQKPCETNSTTRRCTAKIMFQNSMIKSAVAVGFYYYGQNNPSLSLFTLK